MPETDVLAWWGELRQGGGLLSPSALATLLEGDPPPLPARREANVHAALVQVLDAASPSKKQVGLLIDRVLEDALGYAYGWLKPSAILADWTASALGGESIKPQRLWRGKSGGLLPVFVTEPQVTLGLGRGKRLGARVSEWLRRKGVAIALLTNGLQWRLIHAGADHEAFVEWEAAAWFSSGKPAASWHGLRQVLGIQALRPDEANGEAPLLSALRASRRGHSDLSQRMGEQVRQAVELLITAQAHSLDAIREEVAPRVLYVAACRIIMRMVVLLFAEARGLLPCDNGLYRDSYSLSSLQDRLLRGASNPRPAFSAWPRVLGAFQVVSQGAFHRDLVVPTYGGTLFEGGVADSLEPLSRALAALESPEGVSDRVVAEILNLLCRTRVSLPMGAQRSWVTVPVDFSDLDSAYIGILYEGLLDFELRRAGEDPVLFLNLGNEPAMPLRQLESLDDKALRALLEGLRKRGEGAEDEEELDEEVPSEKLAAELLPGGGASSVRERAGRWAQRAHEVGRLGGSAKRDKRLIKRIVQPGEWYLVRWGGTRKGSGTFYTRPELTLPMVRRTLHPLVYEKGAWGQGERPRSPEAILGLTICDPSMGSGSFLVAALRYLTEALLQSLYAHGRIQAHGRQAVVTLASGLPSSGELCEEVLPLPPDDENFEPMLRARLKRHLVERCLYGVDLDPLAVELGKLALWVETMDRELPFSFLDHKLKVGNALIGTFFDRYLNYPVMAWEREGGDKGHPGVSLARESWSAALKACRPRIRAEMEQLLTGSLNWLSEDRSRAAIDTHTRLRETLTRLHQLPIHRSDLREALYREEIAGSPALHGLKQAFDTWCALWFWPADRISSAPTPLNYLDPPPETLQLVAQLAETHRFFHWELEFPDVFTAPGAGFDAVIGNPPWETPKPNSQEFFSNHDARFRSYGKQEALRQQLRYFASDAELERRWLDLNATLKAQSNWVRHAASPFGAFQAALSDSSWARRLASPPGYCDPEHPFRHQGGSDPNTYKMFLEMGHALLRKGGQLGLIVPSSLYGDKGAQALRELFLSRCRWRWLFGFENRQAIFDIHRAFKFCMVILEKGGETGRLRAAFMRQDRLDWENAEELAFDYDAGLLRRFSPKSQAFLELSGKRDIELLQRIYGTRILLGETGPGSWELQSGREFHMTDDSALFAPRPDWEAKGYRPDADGRWVGSDGKVALPLYQGVMIHQYDYAAKAWVRGTGLSALWEGLPWESKRPAPQFLMAREDAMRKGERVLLPKVTYRSIARNTDERTLIASLNPGMPCGHKLGVLRSPDPILTCALPALLNSFVLDWVARIRIGGTQVDAHVLAELPLVDPGHELLPFLALNALRLNGPSPLFAPLWVALSPYAPEGISWHALHAVTPHERLRLRCVTEALIAWLYDLRPADLRRMLDPDPSNARGFWRVDRELPPELRLTTLTLAAFEDLHAKGVKGFLEQHEGEAWQLPETLEIEGEIRPVRQALGPRHAPWQLEKPVAGSWESCRDHARRIMEAGSHASKREASGTMGMMKLPCLF